MPKKAAAPDVSAPSALHDEFLDDLNDILRLERDPRGCLELLTARIDQQSRLAPRPERGDTTEELALGNVKRRLLPPTSGTPVPQVPADEAAAPSDANAAVEGADAPVMVPESTGTPDA